MLRSPPMSQVPSLFAAVALLIAMVCGGSENAGLVADRAVAAPPAAAASTPIKLEWMTDYGDAMKRAELGRKMLLVYFYDKEPGEAQRRFERESLTDAQVLQRLQNFMVVRLPTDYEVSVGGERSKLMEHDAFAELNGKPGAAIIDFAHDAEDYHGYVVSILPLSDGKYYRFTPKYLSTLLDLPPGTLTQRTMIFAVRIHPEAPQSTRGRLSSVLTGEAREHSRHQARIRVQGHHNWSHRFQRITGLLPFGLRAQEVVAESWPNEGLVDAAIDCVDSWRQSPGHWGAVVSDQPHYGYDIKRGENGIWYATGLFGNSE
jgi:hypothetical protein